MTPDPTPDRTPDPTPDPTPDTAGLLLQDLTIRFRAAGPALLQGFTQVLPPGSTLVITGPAGSGKSTVLATLAGLRAPTSGRVLLGGHPVTPDQLGRTVGYAPQNAAVFGTLTAVENLALILLSQGATPADAWSQAENQLHEVGLVSSVQHNLAEQLSGGQRQRVGFARAAVGRPRLLIADDPTSELDHASAELVLAVLRRLTGTGSSVVLATTDPEVASLGDVTMRLGDSG